MQTFKDRGPSGFSLLKRGAGVDNDLYFHVAMRVDDGDALEIEIMRDKPAFAVASTSSKSARGSLDRSVFALLGS